MAESPPNIIFIFADQMRGDCMGAVGGEALTPNIDRLAEEGIVFEQCMSNSPLCVPARTCLMTGQLVRENGIWSNRSGADPLGPSHVRNLRDSGYRTAVIGKTHLWRHGPGGKPGIHVKQMAHVLEQWGFNESVELNDPIETAWMDCHYTDYLAANGWLDLHRAFIRAWVAEMRSGNMTPWGQEPAPVPEGADEDSFIGRTAVEWIENYDKGKPFYLQIQFTGPHDPYDGPTAYRDLYNVEELDAGARELEEPPSRGMAQFRARSPSVARATRFQKQRWRAWYYANVTLIDKWIGEVRTALEKQGLLDSTWIVFNSDHGEMLGDHGLQGKAVFYRDAMHVPCVIRPPKALAARKSQALVEQIDLPATMLAMADAQPLADSLGKSLLPYLDYEPEDPRLHEGKPAVLSELFGQTAIVTDQYTLAMRIEDEDLALFFDRHEDAGELRNFKNEADYASVASRLIEEHVHPLAERTNHTLLDDYRNYVRTTGSIN
ncbi:MAG: sulfatase-like hydrolase/transferase [Gammaproteobacteria bacterium]|nr:sulfatase-like hydrolase/transferase [Gammaproteobacteria bacterium]